MEAMNAENAARVDTATLAALLDGDGDGAAAPPPLETTTGAVEREAAIPIVTAMPGIAPGAEAAASTALPTLKVLKLIVISICSIFPMVDGFNS